MVTQLLLTTVRATVHYDKGKLSENTFLNSVVINSDTHSQNRDIFHFLLLVFPSS